GALPELHRGAHGSPAGGGLCQALPVAGGGRGGLSPELSRSAGPLSLGLGRRMEIRERSRDDDTWIEDLLNRRWGGTVMISHGESIGLMDRPALVAGEREGLATYRVSGAEAELLSLDAETPGRGVGSLLLAALVARLSGQGVTRLWVTTTNDNLAALGFHQRR